MNLYPEYNIKSPSSITLSSALVLGNFGLISLDLESKDYSKTKVKPKRDFLNLNNEISKELQNTLNIRIGSEVKLNKLSLRAGYNSIESPYKNLVDNSSSISFGFGYDFTLKYSPKYVLLMLPIELAKFTMKLSLVGTFEIIIKPFL